MIFHKLEEAKGLIDMGKSKGMKKGPLARHYTIHDVKEYCNLIQSYVLIL